MSTLLAPSSELDEETNQSAAHRVRHQFTACRIRFQWLGTSKSLNAKHKLNGAYVSGAFIMAGLIGAITGSWLIFLIALGIIVSIQYHDGSLRL